MVDGSAVFAARKVLDVVERYRAEAERDAQMAAPVRAAVGDAGLFALTAPADCGGYDATLPEIWETVEITAEVDPTVSWHIANTTIAGLVSSRLDLETRTELYADPRFPFGNGAVPIGRAQPEEGGSRLSGRWPFVTGIEHSRWNTLAALVSDVDGPTGPGGYGSKAARVFSHGEQPRFQRVITDAEATWATLRLGWHDVGNRLWAAARTGGPEPTLRAEGFSAMFHVVDTARRTVSELYSIATNAAYRTQNPIERALRDSHAGAASAESFRGLQQDAARVFAGAQPLSPAF